MHLKSWRRRAVLFCLHSVSFFLTCYYVRCGLLLCQSSLYSIDLSFLLSNAFTSFFLRYSGSVSSWRRDSAVFLPPTRDDSLLHQLFVFLYRFFTIGTLLLSSLGFCAGASHFYIEEPENQSEEQAPCWDGEILAHDDSDSLCPKWYASMNDTCFYYSYRSLGRLTCAMTTIKVSFVWVKDGSRRMSKFLPFWLRVCPLLTHHIHYTCI
jgi:hypothetical protein